MFHRLKKRSLPLVCHAGTEMLDSRRPDMESVLVRALVETAEGAVAEGFPP